MEYEKIMSELEYIAAEYGVELTENAEKIARFRARRNIPMDICPCDGKSAPERGCIGTRCEREIEEKGICHCHLFKKI